MIHNCQICERPIRKVGQLSKKTIGNKSRVRTIMICKECRVEEKWR